jgi:predicted alpha/beta superfamily hydrolase
MLDRLHLSSEHLNRDVAYQVYVPPEAIDPEARFPVIYVFDGQELFFHFVSLQQRLSRFQDAPPFIVVAVHTPYPQRYREFSQFHKINDFMTKELLPKILGDYPVSGRSLLAGWQYAGAFAVSALVTNKTIFDGAIAASPFPLSNPVTLAHLQAVQADISMKTPGYVFIGMAEHREASVTSMVDDYLLQIRALPNNSKLDWHAHVLLGEDHRSSYADTFYRGILGYFKNYGALWFTSIADFEQQGGLKRLDDYITDRKQRYGQNDKIVNESRWNLLKLATSEDDFKSFSTLFNAFKTTTFEASQKAHTLKNYAAYFAANHDLTSAIRLYRKVLQQQPNDTELKDILARLEQSVTSQ